MRFLHCSDVHITGNYSSIPFLKLGWRRWIALGELTWGGRAKYYANARESLRAIADRAEALKVDHLIVSGDLTAYALDEEFAGAREALERWASDKRRLTVIPGNHDVYTPGAKRSGRFEKYFGALLESDLPEFAREGAFPFVRLVGDDTAVIGLLSARVPAVPGMSFGVIGPAQLEGLRAAVEDERLKSRAIVVVVHHAPLNKDGRPDKPFHGLRDAKQLFEIARGPRFAVLHGHIHKRYHHPAQDDRPHIFGAGSSTQRGREGYWLFETSHGLISRWSMHDLSETEAAEPARLEAHAR